MKKMLQGLRREMLRLYRDEQGADMLEYILIVAAIALPLLAVIILFWRNIREKATDWWNRISGDVENEIP